jgi:MoaA/NifB/PqqE/SkfB family radical SAM enzyme
VSALLDSVRLEAQQHFHRLQVLPIVVLYLNNVCDSKCKTCAIWKNNEWLKLPAERQMTDSLLQELYGTIAKWRPKQILLSGGEPVLHPRFHDAARRFKEIAGRVAVITNGLLLYSFEPAALEPVDEFYISFDAPDPRSYEHIRGVDGFGRLSASLAMLRGLQHRPKIVARCTLQRDNVRRLPELVSTAKQLGFDSISFLAVDVSSAAFSRDVHGISDIDAIRPSHEDLKIMEGAIEVLSDVQEGFIEGGIPKLRRLLQYFRALLGQNDFPSVRCNAPWTSVVIETTGKIRGCFFQPVIGDFRNINGKEAVDFRRGLNVDTDPTCKRCVCSKFVGTHEFVRM